MGAEQVERDDRSQSDQLLGGSAKVASWPAASGEGSIRAGLAAAAAPNTIMSSLVTCERRTAAATREGDAHDETCEPEVVDRDVGVAVVRRLRACLAYQLAEKRPADRRAGGFEHDRHEPEGGDAP
jgi:hypothetical protein